MAAEVIKCLLITTGTNTTGRKPSPAPPSTRGCGLPQNSQIWSFTAEKTPLKARNAPSEKSDDPAVFFLQLYCVLAAGGDPNYRAGPFIWLLLWQPTIFSSSLSCQKVSCVSQNWWIFAWILQLFVVTAPKEGSGRTNKLMQVNERIWIDGFLLFFSLIQLLHLISASDEWTKVHRAP